MVRLKGDMMSTQALTQACDAFGVEYEAEPLDDCVCLPGYDDIEQLPAALLAEIEILNVDVETET